MSEYFATCPRGAEQLLAAELARLGVDDPQPTRGGVAFSSTAADVAYRVCLHSALHQRLLLILGRFQARTPDELYAGVQQVDWSEHLAVDGTLRIDAKLRDTELGKPHFAALRAKDAIVDQFRARFDQRPSIRMRSPDLRIDLFVHRESVQLATDLTGVWKAETPSGAVGDGIDAALVLGVLKQWPADVVIAGAAHVDVIAQAAMRASAAAPGLLKHDFGFAGWLGHVPARWQRLCDEARQAQRAAPDEQHPRIHVYEPDLKRLGRARRHAKAFGLEAWVQWHDQGAWKMKPPAASGVLLVCPSRDDSAQQAAVEHAARSRFEGWQVVHRSESGETQGRAWRGKAQQVLKISRGKRNMQVQLFDLSTHTRPLEVSPAPRQPVAETLAEPVVEPAPDLINRLGKNHKHLRRWALREGVDCYRLYDADLPEYAAAVDLYHGDALWAVIQEYAAPAKLPDAVAAERLEQVVDGVRRVLDLPPQRVVVKTRQRQRGQAQYEKLGRDGDFHVVQEGGLKLLVNFTDYLDTGLFLDHRSVRAELGRQARDRHVLNLFAYTGVATLHMVAGGAKSSTTVDMSRTYLSWAKRNLLLNGLHGNQHQFVQADCLHWLAEQAKDPASKRYGLIFMDPPTFSRSKRMQDTLDIQRDHVSLIRQAVTLLRPGGELFFSNNFRRFKLDEAALSDLAIRDITAATLPEDFKRRPRIHYCYRIRRA